ncbi:MAG: carbohydrate ABC transporter permease, partial [Candidatus Bipolaricaulia bacterium]
MSERIVRALTRGPLHFVIIAICLVWMLPSLGLLISSFRPAVDVTSSGWWSVFQTPFKFTQFTIANYVEVIADQGMGRAFVNSLFITLPATVIPILIAAFAAYAFAWMRFRGRNILFIIIVGLLVVPLQMTL